jgi:hypothetical protein
MTASYNSVTSEPSSRSQYLQAALRLGAAAVELVIQRQAVERRVPRLRERDDGEVADGGESPQIAGAKCYRLERPAREVDAAQLARA